jgi:hypothetical protein
VYQGVPYGYGEVGISNQPTIIRSIPIIAIVIQDYIIKTYIIIINKSIIKVSIYLIHFSTVVINYTLCFIFKVIEDVIHISINLACNKR